MEAKLVQRFGNGAHVVLPKEYVGKRMYVVAAPLTIDEIRSDIIDIIKPYTADILGVYLCGSYARDEQQQDSDADILVITNDPLRLPKTVGQYSITFITIRDVIKVLHENAILILPMLREAVPLINPLLLEHYKDLQFTKKNTVRFITGCKDVFSVIDEGIVSGFEVGSIVYSLVLRIRGLFMIQLANENTPYSNEALFSFLHEQGLSRRTVDELYKIYLDEKKNKRVKERATITSKDCACLLTIARKLLHNTEKKLR